MEDRDTDGEPAGLLHFQLDMLKLEVDQANKSILQIDQITQTTKYWCIVLWAGSITFALSKGQESLRKYLLMTIVIPIIFWFIEMRWRRIQRAFIFRIQKISEYMNGPGLSKSFKQGKLVDFEALDPKGRQYKNTPEYKKFCSQWPLLLFRRVVTFYLSLAFLSAVLWFCLCRF